MNVVIIVAAGTRTVGLLVDMLADAVRRRQFLDIGVAAGVVALTVWLLFTYGDSLLQ